MNTLYPTRAAKAQRREQVLLGIWNGCGTKEIAAGLGISPKTVEYHRAQLYRVFHVSDPVSLCRRAMLAGVLAQDGVSAGEKTEARRKERRHD